MSFLICSQLMSRPRHVRCISEMKNAVKIFVSKPQMNTSSGWEVNADLRNVLRLTSGWGLNWQLWTFEDRLCTTELVNYIICHFVLHIKITQIRELVLLTVAFLFNILSRVVRRPCLLAAGSAYISELSQSSWVDPHRSLTDGLSRVAGRGQVVGAVLNTRFTPHSFLMLQKEKKVVLCASWERRATLHPVCLHQLYFPSKLKPIICDPQRMKMKSDCSTECVGV